MEELVSVLLLIMYTLYANEDKGQVSRNEHLRRIYPTLAHLHTHIPKITKENPSKNNMV